MNEAPEMTAARTAWGEARGEGADGMQAILNVIGNRVKVPCWWGADIAGVCRAPEQFSCWDETDPNRERLLSVTLSDPQFREAVTLAHRLTAGLLVDLTGGADHYYDWRGPRPFWAEPRFFTTRIGHHDFYRTGPYSI